MACHLTNVQGKTERAEVNNITRVAGKRVGDIMGMVIGISEDSGSGEVGEGVTAWVRAWEEAKLRGRIRKKLWTKKSCRLGAHLKEERDKLGKMCQVVGSNWSH